MGVQNQFLSVSAQQLDKAYHWLCQQRRGTPYYADVWDFRFHWAECKEGLLMVINQGDYVFLPLRKIVKVA